LKSGLQASIEVRVSAIEVVAVACRFGADCVKFVGMHAENVQTLSRCVDAHQSSDASWVTAGCVAFHVRSFELV
jgi:hypothetical protein